MNFFPKIDKWLIPGEALKRSQDELAVDGRNGKEGICLWLGKKDQGMATLSHLVYLRGAGVIKHPANVQVTPELMRDVHDEAMTHGVILIGQIHSHSRRFGVNLSLTDHRYGIRVPYFLSVVCPDYGQTNPTTIFDCGVHVFLPEKGYVRLINNEIREKILLTPQTNIPILTVGETYE